MSNLDSLITSNRERAEKARKSIESKLKISPDSPESIKYIWSGTQSEYDALSETRNDTLYFIE